MKMTSFTYFTGGGAACINDPQVGIDFYRYMTGSNKCGNPFTNDFTGQRNVPTIGYGSGPRSATIFSGDPDVPGTWSECFSGNPPGDRRFVHSAVQIPAFLRFVLQTMPFKSCLIMISV
jgi:hypothetical protein